MSAVWPTVRLGELLHQQLRETVLEPDKPYDLVGAHWYAKGLYIKDRKYGSQIKAARLYRIEEKDFVYNRLFAWKGSFAVVPTGLSGCHVSNEFPCFQINKDRLDPVFLWYYFSLESSWNRALGLSFGATPTSRNRLKEERFLSLEIPLPPLSEQRRIVARIEELAAKIAEARSLRKQAAEEAAALLSSVRLRVIGSSRQSHWIPLSSYVMEIENGKSPATEGRPALRDEWAVLKVGAVSLGFFDEGENKALPVSYAPLPRYEVKSGDFLMSRANTSELVGACAVVRHTRPKLMLSDKIFRFIFHDSPRVNPRYVDHVLKSPPLREQIVASASGTSPTMKNISKEKVLGLLIPPNTLPEQHRIAAYLDGFQTKVDTLKRLQSETASELDAMLPAILDRAFKGEL